MPFLFSMIPDTIFSFHWYGLIVGVAMALFLLQWQWWLERSLKRQGPTLGSDPLTNTQLNLGWLAILLGAIIGARLYHLWTDWSLYAQQPWTSWLALGQGGIGFLGALLGGATGMWFWWERVVRGGNQIPNAAPKPSQTRITWFTTTDAAALSLPLAQALGRLGNYVNQELFGPPTAAPWGIFIEPAYRPIAYQSATHFHPLFLYESLMLVLIGLWLISSHRYFQKLFPLGSGFYTAWYLLGYGSVRLTLEWLRLNSAPGWLGLTIAQWVCLGLIGVGFWLLPRRWEMIGSINQ